MKRIYIALAALTVMVSCQVRESSISEVNPKDLFNYSASLFINYVDTPAAAIELLTAFDEYLSLPESEKEKDTVFYGHVGQLYDTVYEIYNPHRKNVICVVDTGGKSLQDESATWVLASLEAYGTVDSMMPQYYSGYTLPEYTEVRMTDRETSTYMIGYKGLFETYLTYCGEDNGRKAWNIRCTGEVSSSSGLKARFSTGEDYVEIKERLTEDYRQYLGCTAKGDFYVDIYNGDTLMDWCHMTMRPGFSVRYQTGR